ncbi:MULTISPECIES: AAA family ATPase [Synergistaceae]|uniref:AAA family ATPase n=1 Tax=Synergistaceae TaxID=649777 RepID=UPI003ADF7D5E|nr:AAA family ATPase [Synergistaceae bacterium DZ-S4]
MKLINLHILKFRGIVDLNLNLNGKNAVIFGPNGVGKSAVVDAIDFLLLGKVSRLAGEGTGEVSTAKHAPHIGMSAEESKVTAKLESKTGEIFTVERSVANSDIIIINPNNSDSNFQEMVAYAQRGAHCLARRELLKFILTTPATRSQQIQILLNISDTKTIRDALTKLKKTTAKNLEETEQSLELCYKELQKNVGAKLDEQLLHHINYLRSILGGGPLTSLGESSFLEGLSYADTKENLEMTACFQNILDLQKYIPTMSDVLKEKLSHLHNIVTKIDYEDASINNFNYISLLKSGLAMLDGSGRCPLCQHQWASEAELRSILEDRKENNEHLSEIYDEYQKSIDELLREILTYKSKMESSLQQIKKYDNDCVKELENEISMVSKALFDDSGKYENFRLINEVVQEIINQNTEMLLYQIQKLISILGPQIDDKSKEKSDAWQVLNTTNGLFLQIKNLNEKIPLISLQKEKATLLLATYDSAQAKVLNELFVSIRDRFTEFYREMHSDDEIDFSAELNNDGAGVNLSVDFFGQGQFPPMAFHSEGHQDSMGISLFFALMEKLTTSESGLVVLDDVVMSVDIEHRRKFCKLMSKYFSERQFIITTHDTVWANNLVIEGIVPSENKIHFLNWNIKEGPIVQTGKNIWDMTRMKAQNEIHEASAFFRREMECFFENLCDKLKARIRYNSLHKWVYGQYMNAAYKEFQDLIKNAQGQADLFKNTDATEQLKCLSDSLRKEITAVNQNNGVINCLLHYNPQYEISKDDLLSAVNAMEKLCKSFECPHCKNIISVNYSGEKPIALMCKCGKYSFPLK